MEMDIIKAAEILGIPVDADIDKVEHRYTILVRQYKMTLTLGEDGNGAGSGIKLDIGEINEAVRVMRSALMATGTAAPSYRESKILKKMGVDEKKLRNKIYYYKWHVLVGAIVLTLIAFFVADVVAKPKPEANIAVIGDFGYFTPEALENAILEELPEINAINIDSAIGGTVMEGADYTVQIKRTVLIAANEVDIYICDREFYNEATEQGVFMRIDEFQSEYGIVGLDVKEEDFGIRIEKDSPYYEMIGSRVDMDKIVCVASKIKNIEKTAMILKLLLSGA
ncbi:MAG: hypothetical protein FWH55_02945 [Oscillospiraceae bacterium]|nr:hypothetical protein [Oscillospiraceae bacterium]